MQLKTRALALAFVTLVGSIALISEAAELRVLTYNIHHGEGTDGELDLERIAGVIKSVNPDLVAVQEVDDKTERTNKVDQPAELARLTGMKAIFEKNIDFQGGGYGNAVLSRLPVSGHKNIALPSMYEGEQRGMLIVDVEGPGGEPIRFAATHLDYRPGDDERWASAELINKLFTGEYAGQPALLAGDFNATPDSRVLERLGEVWRVPAGGNTIPAKQPTRRIDYVVYRPAGRWSVTETKVLDEPVASDHRPVLYVLELLEAGEKSAP